MAKYMVNIYWDQDDQIFVACAPELPGCMAHGDTQEEALASIHEAIDFWLDTARELGREIPQPARMPMAVGQ